MRGHAEDRAVAAQGIVSMHAVEGADERITAMSREIGTARRLLSDCVKKCETLAEAIDGAVRYLEHEKQMWKAQRAAVVPALRAAQDLARRVAGVDVDEEEV